MLSLTRKSETVSRKYSRNIFSSYEVFYYGPVDEEWFLSKCRSAIDGVNKVEKEIRRDYSSGQLNGSELEEL
ncbi:hypothetical protein FRX31_017184 [Thalictrum thalictroides]|uniref:Uncharacterized protein n=1 Tax=Thalictrum thalictroides TaxID=46969 RepID=A0A7J6WAJ4_THATH|nr:hypothetical protein FRX31_017184 [Thalictrum thalictroides]